MTIQQLILFLTNLYFEYGEQTLNGQIYIYNSCKEEYKKIKSIRLKDDTIVIETW